MAPKPLITVDGNVSEWAASQRIDYGDLLGYSLYAQAQGTSFDFALNAPIVIGANTTVWFNTDMNAATGYQIFGTSGGAEFNLNIKADGTAALYTGAAGQTLVLDNIQLAYSTDHLSIEFAIPKTALGSPSAVGAMYDVNDNPLALGPVNYSAQPYVVYQDLSVVPTHRVAIVYSGTSAALYFSPTAYSDLFMAAQNQARMAGVSYDVIDESQLTNINNLVGYDALIFPSMADVNSAQLPAIMATLTSAVYNYHIGIITSGDFLTNDQTGAALAGNSYANMQTLLGLARYTGGSGDVTVTANDVSNPIMDGYTTGQVIQSYVGQSYNAYNGTAPADVLVNQNIGGVALPGVVETTTGGTNVHFASAALLGDSNLLSNAIQGVVLGSEAGVALHTSRQAGIVAERMDMDLSQFPADVSPAGGGGGIYDKLIPILQQWKTQYNFVGSYYINIGDNPLSATEPTTTDWTKSLAYYKAIEAMGGEIGNHSYTHLTNPPATTVAETTTTDTPAGSIQVTLAALPAFAGITVGMVVTGLNIGANTQVTAVSGNTLTLSYVPGGYGTANLGVLGDIPPGTTLTFGIPTENTNFLQTGTGPFTYDYEFNQSKLIEQTQLGHPIFGAAVPGAPETYATAQSILAYYQSVAATATTPGYTGYVTGGWTGVGAGYPGAIGYMSPTSQGSVYIAPNITFDFTEIQYQGKTVAQAGADWAAQFNAIAANTAGTPIVVWPIHDYGATAWVTPGSTELSPYTTQMYTDFIALAAGKGYEFVTLEDLASRIVAQQKAQIDYTTVGNTITATVTPDPTAPDVGEMSLNVVNGSTNVIQNVTNWYAYNTQELFLPRNGGSFTINLGATQDDVTHIASLPMRGDLLSVTGNGLDLSFSMVGEGDVIIDLGGTSIPVVTGATVVSLVRDQLDLRLTGLGQHDVAVHLLAPPTEVVSTVLFSADTGSSVTDFVTNVVAQTISGTLSSALATGDVVKVSLDNGITWLTASAAVGATAFSLSGVTLTGSGTLIARVENAALLSSAAFTQAYVLDQAAPAAPTEPDLLAVSDSGVSSTDNITSIALPTFTGMAEIGATVTLFDGTTAVGTGIAAAGTWTITASHLTSGIHSFTANAVDVAGNISAASIALPVTIDTPIPDPANPANFSITDVSTGAFGTSAGQHYTGPVAGLTDEIIIATTDNINVTANIPNVFIHTGSGDDALNVGGVNGNNVLDGGTGSNFMVGGSGADTFFVDDRLPTTDIWSTVANFGAGDAATIWGITPEDFNLAWVNDQGAAGYTGLTLHATAAGRPMASLTLAGYSQADLNNNRLSVQFGTDSASGSTYMYVHGNS
jgi:serralysin